MTDDLERLLGPPSGLPGDRTAILAATTRLVRRRRWVRVGTRGVLAAGLFAAGWFARPPVQFVEVVAVPVWVPPPAPPPPEPYLPPDRVELAAELATDRTEAARLYRLAGDRYLTDAGEPGQAARCYRLHLQHAGPAGLAVGSADSWLLTSLKTQRLAEVRDGDARGL